MLNDRKKPTKTHFKIGKSLLACLQQLISLGSDVISLSSLPWNVTPHLHGYKIKFWAWVIFLHLSDYSSRFFFSDTACCISFLEVSIYSLWESAYMGFCSQELGCIL